MAHAIVAKLNITLGEALKKAWKAVKLQVRMRLDKAEFSFRKADGSIRKAIGTLSGNLFSYTPSTTGRKWENPVTLITYFDLEKKAFRSFNAYNLI